MGWRMDDPYNLERFVKAQERVFGEVISELRMARKTSHWMWFVFPQIRGLGHSHMAQMYAISSRGEAEAYLNHPLLGPRLRECTRLVLQADGRSADEIFGSPDNLKLKSSMTLFAHVTADNQLFLDVLSKYFDGQEDARTIDRL
jgi:uncharacterized protein (DUF1810 family)